MKYFRMDGLPELTEESSFMEIVLSKDLQTKYLKEGIKTVGEFLQHDMSDEFPEPYRDLISPEGLRMKDIQMLYVWESWMNGKQPIHL